MILILDIGGSEMAISRLMAATEREPIFTTIQSEVILIWEQ